MGLDMYLSRHTYVKNWEFMNPEELTSVTVLRGGKSIAHIEPEKISYIIEEVAYWRKANHIHAWFVKNCQDGVDDCRDYWVPLEKLEELVSLCKKVKSNPSLGPELLPTSGGFFFGSTDYDEWYMQDIDITIEQLKPLVENKEISAEYYYRSSW